MQQSLPSMKNINPLIHLDDFTSRVTKIFLESIELLVPIAKPSQYNKRWWTEDLSLLCKNYTYFQNQARRHQQNEHLENVSLHSSALLAKREYHNTLRKQTKQYWEEFLNEPGNIWETCRYINENPNQASFTLIPPLQTILGTAFSNSEIAQKFLIEFFPPLLSYPPVISFSSDTHSYQLPIMPISRKEIAKAVFSASPFKEAGPDGIPAII